MVQVIMKPKSVIQEEQNYAIDVASLNLMLDASVDCIKLIDLSGNLQKMNRAGCEALGVAPGAPLGMKWLSLLPEEIRARGRRALKLCHLGRRASFAGKSKLPGENPVFWDNILTPLRDDNGRISAILCVSRDITRQIQAEQKLRIASDFDMLTKVANRRYLVRHARKVIQARAKSSGLVGVLVIDVDHFKSINDEKGHDAGDCAIRHIAKALEGSIRKGEFLARLGGDEFALFIKAIDDRHHLEEVAARCMTSTSAGFTYKGEHIQTRLSIGGSFASASDSNLSSLLKAADVALYKAKTMGRGRFYMAAPNETEVMMHNEPATVVWEDVYMQPASMNG